MTAGELFDSQSSLKFAKLGLVLSENQMETPEETSEQISFQWQNVASIFSDLRAGYDVGFTTALISNSDLASTGIKLHGGGFVLTKSEALAMGFGQIDTPLAKNNDVIKAYRNGRDLMGKCRDVFVIDFNDLTKQEASQYLQPFQRVFETVKPERDVYRDKQRREQWWRFGRSNKKMRTSVENLDRYVVTTQTSKHRTFQSRRG